MRIAPICLLCKHLLNGEKFACKAFAEIPDDIIFSRFDHRQPYPGDNGIQFEPIESSGMEKES